MLDFIKRILPDGLLRAMVLKTARHLATAIAGFLASYLLAHHANGIDVQNITAGLSALIVGGAGYAFSLWDAKSVDIKIKVAAETGMTPQDAANAQAAADRADTDRVQGAMDHAQAGALATTNDEALARLREHNA